MQFLVFLIISLILTLVKLQPILPTQAYLEIGQRSNNNIQVQESKVCRDGKIKHDEDMMDFGVVPTGGAIVHPHCWRREPTEGNGYASP